MAPFDANLQVEPYEETIATGIDEIREKFGYIFKSRRVFTNEPLAVLTEILNEWFDNDDSDLLICEGETLKRISTKNPQAKFYKWHIDYESLKIKNDEYGETVKLQDWNILAQFREEYQQSRFYWRNRDRDGMNLSMIAVHEALTAMVPQAVLIEGEWVEGPQSDIFDMDVFAWNSLRMRSGMRYWIHQISALISSCPNDYFVTSVYYR